MSGLAYVVLGMHKSGTTLVSRILHASGVTMLDAEAEGSYDEGNFYERTSTLEINRTLLAGCFVPPLRRLFGPAPPAGDGDYAHSLSLVRRRAVPNEAPPELARRMRTVIAQCAAAGDWGFKDPRTCLTYPLWREQLAEHRLVVVYRGWTQLLARYRVGGWRQLNLPRLYRVLDAWAVHNDCLLRYVGERAVPALVLRYEALMAGDAELARLAAFVGRDLVDVREPARYRHREASPPSLPPAARWLLAPFLRASPAAVLRGLEAARREQAAAPSVAASPTSPNGVERGPIGRSAQGGTPWTGS